jgi:hypothetical protein
LLEPLLLFVPGPTLPSLEGFAALLDFVLEPVVVDELDLACLCDFASAANGALAGCERDATSKLSLNHESSFWLFCNPVASLGRQSRSRFSVCARIDKAYLCLERPRNLSRAAIFIETDRAAIVRGR